MELVSFILALNTIQIIGIAALTGAVGLLGGHLIATEITRGLSRGARRIVDKWISLLNDTGAVDDIYADTFVSYRNNFGGTSYNRQQLKSNLQTYKNNNRAATIGSHEASEDAYGVITIWYSLNSIDNPADNPSWSSGEAALTIDSGRIVHERIYMGPTDEPDEPQPPKDLKNK